MSPLKKIVVIGPESTGKSTLCSELAAHFGTSWVPEFARQFLLDNGKAYTYDDLLTIAKGQVAAEEAAVRRLGVGSRESGTAPCPPPPAHRPLFIDTDMYVMKVWCEYVFGKCHQWIIDQAAIRTYDLYLLCNTDLPWMKDELREYPDLETRETLFHIYKDIMVNQSTPWVEIKGLADERMAIAVDAVNRAE